MFYSYVSFSSFSIGEITFIANEASLEATVHILPWSEVMCYTRDIA